MAYLALSIDAKILWLLSINHGEQYRYKESRKKSAKIADENVPRKSQEVIGWIV